VKKIARPMSNIRSGEITANASPTVIIERERTEPVKAAGARAIPMSWWIAGAAVIVSAVLAAVLILRGL
jgi:hypothetical protein